MQGLDIVVQIGAFGGQPAQFHTGVDQYQDHEHEHEPLHGGHQACVLVFGALEVQVSSLPSKRATDSLIRYSPFVGALEGLQGST